MESDFAVSFHLTLSGAGVLVHSMDNVVVAFAAVDVRRSTMESLRAEMVHRMPETVHVGPAEEAVAEMVTGAVDELQSAGMRTAHLSLPESTARAGKPSPSPEART